MSEHDDVDDRYRCPACGTPARMVIGPTQALCPNDVDCQIIMFNPSLPDGGMSSPRFIDLRGF